MIFPRDEFAAGIDAAREEMVACGAIVVVMEVIFAGPKKLDRNADFFGDGASFEHVIVGEATAEAAAHALQVDDDVIFRNAEN